MADGITPADPNGADPAKPPRIRNVNLDIEGPDRRLNDRPISHAQEGARRYLAFFLVGILAIEILFAMTATWVPSNFGGTNLSVEMLKEIMTLVFGPTIALVGSAAGFYFGTRPADKD